MSDDKRIPVEEDGDISRYQRFSADKLDVLASVMKAARSVQGDVGIGEVEEKIKIMNEGTELLKKVRIAMQNEDYREAYRYCEEGLQLKLESQYHMFWTLKCSCGCKSNNYKRFIEDFKTGLQAVPQKDQAEFKTNVMTVFFKGTLMHMKDMFYEVREKTKVCTKGQMEPLSEIYDMMILGNQGLQDILKDKQAGVALAEVAEKQGWDLDVQPWLMDMVDTAFSYSRAAHDNGMEIPAGSYYFREAEVIGIQAMERILPLITENDDRAKLCEYLAMAYARSMDRVKVLQEAEKNPQVRKYLTMMEKMDSDYKMLYDHAVEEGEKRAAIVKNLQINQDILKAGIEQMTINVESLDRRIRNLQKGFFYALNVFDWINEKKLKKERDNLQEKIARKKYNLIELEKRIAQLV